MTSYLEVWELVKEYCKNHVTSAIYSLWLEPLTMVSFENDKIVLITDEFKAGIVRDKFMDLLNEAFENTMGFTVEVEIISSESQKNNTKDNSLDLISQNSDIKYDFTFDTFIVGQSNKFAHAAALAVANLPGQAYNPLFIYGNSGLGKTHLLNAICNEIRKNNPDTKIIYTSGENFTNELILAIKQNTQADFHNKYRTADILLVDDIHFIAKKESTQEEFFHTFNTLIQDNKQIVLTSDRPPKEIAHLEDRIKSRFEWGLLADIQPPDIETRMAIIKRNADLMDLNLPDEVIQYIAEQIKNNIRQLEGTVKKISALYKINGHESPYMIAQRAIRDLKSDGQSQEVTIQKIINEVARTYGITSENILSNKRNANISHARQIAMYIIREVYSLPMEQIGEIFGGKHHSTVIYNINQAEEEINSNSSTKATVQSIINNINENI